jgi:glycosyltransferase involved in cell wall biosynthesis
MRIPWRLRAPVRRARNAVRLARLTARQRPRWRRIAAATPRRGEPAVSYGVERMPGGDHVVYGGAVKFQLLAEAFPNAPLDFNVLYLGSSSMPLESATLVRLARRRGAAFVWNQNGVAYRGWYGDGWDLLNRPRAQLLHQADHVVFQSAFCKLGADRFYGPRDDRYEILHNPVDTRRFTPQSPADRPPTLLLAGNQYQRYRIERALDALAVLRRELSAARLLVTGELSFAPDAREQTRRMLSERRLEDAVDFLGPYTQRAAPEAMRRGDVLLHTKYNDPCPTVVLEAMACGLPVVYSASGGTPELVGDEAGVGIPAPLDWDEDHPPTGDELASAALTAFERLPELREAARARAERFDSRGWIDRHRSLFVELVAS